MSKILAVNSGSSTLKWKLYEVPSEAVIAEGMVDRLGIPGSVFSIKFNGQKKEINEDIETHEKAVNMLLDNLLELNVVQSIEEITGVGHRVVSGGSEYEDSIVVDDKVLAGIKKYADFAPLHNIAELKGIESFMKILPNASEVAVFDTSFHTTMDKENYLYSIPYEYYEKYGVRKFGAHGTSHKYVSQKAAKVLNKPIEDLKMITMHIGSGVSITAIDGGKSVDTSMGFTPLAGVTMSSRSGDIDASLVAYLMNKENINDPDDMIEILNNKSGLLGISGVSPDMRDLIATKDENPRSQLAIDIFINRLVKYVGSYIALLNGVDAIVFTAGMGEHNPQIRQAVIDNFNYMGMKIDETRNENANDACVISADDSTVDVMMIPTDEELMIVRDVVRLTK
ncbi:acetate kinase [Companilactobacillus sp. RD055328]|uniref:acetate/propionate family kinase n=1 Tax=Companilactobacillus sp. RD055328 TaxID=2916634 RepID=UPI001FC8832B|nr:acetate kinase [Companilactobacillus sp. RD055328]GKQ42986.1 acetate kinase [Companilactobacillus sp. RD055328]